MPPRTTRPQSPGHVVTAVLVSHDGARWLGDSLAALSAQVRPPQRVVAVDTGSTDGSADLVASALGESAVVRVARDTPLGVAVKAGLDAFDGAPAPPGTRRAMTEWVWLLHDDCAPEPTALRELLAQAVEQPSVACFGPKTLSWDGGRLLEMGLTVDSSGRRQTGLEERELDQGQHDEVGDVLAVGTAGMLVRRDLWDRLGGLDPAWPLFGDDVDFGWRLNAIGERIRVAPRAVVRHAAALGRGLRPADAAPGRPAAVARRHGLQVVLANTGPVLAPLLAIRYVVEALARALGLLVIRRPVAAADELVGTGGALRHPAAVLAARRQRRNRTVAHSELRSLLAPASLRGRRFGDAIAEMMRGREAAEERRLRRAPVETGPVSEEVESLDLGDTGWVLRAVRRPGVLLALALTALGLLASRDVIGAMLHGGRLLPAPAGAADLWSTYRAAWHPVGLGSTTPTPPFIAVLALFSTVLLGKVWLVVDILVLGAVPLAGLSAYLSARSLTDSWRLRMWAAVSYAVLPALTGAVAGGRIDVVAAMVLLPVVARSVGRALFAGPSSPNRWLGTGLLLAVLVAVAPIAWPMAAAALLATVGVLAGERRRRLLGAVTMLAVPLVALLPWTASVLRHPRLLLNGAGLPEAVRTRLPLPPADVLLLHPGGPAQPPLWVLAPLLLAALAALVRQRGARAARAGLVTFAIGIAATGVVTRFTGTGADPAARPWTGVPMAFAAVGMLMAGLVAAERARAALRQHSFSWRQPAAALLAAAALAGTATSVVTWLVRGAGHPLTAASVEVLPVFAAAEMTRSTAPRVIVLRGDGDLVRYTLLRDPAGPRLGDADVFANVHGAAEGRLAKAVQDAAAGQADAVPALAGLGVSMLIVPGPTAHAVPGLAGVDGLDQVPATGAVVWRSRLPTGELVILPPTVAADVRSGADPPASAAAHPLPAGPGRARTTVPAGPAGRLLVLAEPVSRHWTATFAGHRLTPTRAYGWAQAWRLPAGSGRLDVGRSGDHRTGWLVLQLVAVCLLLVLALPTRRRATEELS